jgi:hypothetical protein
MQPMLWLEEADHAFARRSKEGWKKIGRVISTYHLLSVRYEEGKKLPQKHRARTIILRNVL